MSYTKDGIEDPRSSADGDSTLITQTAGGHAPTFIDLFAGCGGISLGLCQAGWKGRFAVERAEDAFETFRANFLEESGTHQFDWPDWLDQKSHSIEDVLEKKRHGISSLQGKVDLIAGGPPCQGFSFSGKRNASDPRNKMFQRYVQFVDMVRPKFLVLENVPGMAVAHKDGRGTNRKTYYQKLIEELDTLGYEAAGDVLDSTRFGVPQRRSRLVVIGVDRSVVDLLPNIPPGTTAKDFIRGLFDHVEAQGKLQLAEFDCEKVSAACAISDLEVVGELSNNTIEYGGKDSRAGYHQASYVGPQTKYQEWMHRGARPEAMDSMRLAKHTKVVRDRFETILKLSKGRRGLNISADLRTKLSMLKHRTVPMDPAKPAPTLTTLPDDVIHYREPRILTVREYARLQSFPDSFVFRGKYTTGGKLRKLECPRYTQVGNAVPPLLSRAIGAVLMNALGLGTFRREGAANTNIRLPGGLPVIPRALEHQSG